MDMRTGASVRRFESVEIGAVTVIVLASVVQGFFLSRLVPELAPLYAGAGEPRRCAFVSILVSTGP
jgi:hypothetical protein